MKFPSRRKIREMAERLDKVEGTQMLHPDAKPGDRFRWELCQRLVRYIIQNRISQVEFAQMLGIDQARVSEIVRHRIDRVSTDKLIAYNELIDPDIEFKIAK